MTVPVLIVDDSPTKRTALRSILSSPDYTIVEATSGLEALRCVLVQDFAVILLDVRMPVMDGFETAALIRLRWQSESTPIIFITAHGPDEIMDTDRYSEGAVDFIFAPVNPAELRAKVSVFANLFTKAEGLATRAREVQTTADHLRQLTDAAPIGIFETDSRNCYTYTNPRWSEITGISGPDAAGQPWDRILVAGSQAPLGVAELSHRFELGPEGGSRVVLVTSKAMPGPDGGTAGWVGTLADVTAEANVEAAMAEARDQANEASRLKSDFLANMSHEIRTPMNGVIGMTELLLETDLDDRQRDYAETVRSSGEALLTIIDDILDFSKVEAGMLDIDDTDYQVRSVVGDVLALLAEPARTKGLELRSEFDGAVPASLNGDPGRVRQILTNLLGNAIKFTAVGEIVVRVDVAERFDDEAVIRFEVTDTGDGIAADKLGLIFQPFVQADTSTSRKYGGTGLGLAISRQLVTLMGGDCGVSSTLGEGSTFWFTVCLRRGSAGSTATGPDPDLVEVHHPSPSPSSSGLVIVGEAGRLLLAEDNLINQKVAVAMLTSAGYLVDTVVNGAAAVEAVAAGSYDAVLMDCQMPEMNGYEATAAIRASEGAARHTPIIAMTAGARREDRRRCLASGMDGYLAKPVSKDALLAMVRHSIARPRERAS